MTMTTSDPARQYQHRGVAWLRETGRAILADDAGLGKSLQLIRAAEGETLVVAPAMVLDGGTWDDEIAKWADDPGRFTTVPYTSLNLRKGAKNLTKLRPEFDRHWDTVICDEAHYVKGRKSIRTAMVQQLSRQCDRIYLATGTPIPNWAHEVFTLLQTIDPEAAAPGGELGSYWRWAEEWFKIKPTPFSQFNIDGTLAACRRECAELPSWEPCAHYAEFVDANLRGRFLQRRREDVLTDLPPLTEVSVETPMGPKQKAAYNRMKKEYLAETDDNLVVAWSASARHVKLDRLTTGLDLLDVDEENGRFIAGRGGVARADNGKLARLAEDLRDRTRPTLVMAHYRATVEAATAVASELGLRVSFVHGGTSKEDRGKRIRQFQAGELDVLVGSLETLAEGLTLVSADVLIFVEKSYKPSRNEQAMRRVHRLGQTRPVTVLDYVTPKSVDAGKRLLLKKKTDGQMRVLTAAQFKDLL